VVLALRVLPVQVLQVRVPQAVVVVALLLTVKTQVLAATVVPGMLASIAGKE
jgi:hypothetical protein